MCMIWVMSINDDPMALSRVLKFYLTAVAIIVLESVKELTYYIYIYIYMYIYLIIFFNFQDGQY